MKKFWQKKRKEVDSDEEEEDDEEEEEESLSSSSSADGDARHDPDCVCITGSRLSAACYVNPPTLEREAKQPDLELVLRRAHTLLDALERSPATRTKSSSKTNIRFSTPTGKNTKPSASAAADWKHFDTLIATLFQSVKATSTSSAGPSQPTSLAYTASLRELRRRLNAMSSNVIVNSKTFRRTLVSDEAKALSTILRRVRTIPTPDGQSYPCDDHGTAPEDTFVISLQRTVLNQIAFRHKFSEVQRALAHGHWQHRGSRMVLVHPSFADGGPTGLEAEPFRRTVLRSGGPYRSMRQTKRLLQQYGNVLDPEAHPDALSLRELVWIEEGGMPFNNIIPVLSTSELERIRYVKQSKKHQIIFPGREPVLLAPTLCHFPRLHYFEVIGACAEMRKNLQAPWADTTDSSDEDEDKVHGREEANCNTNPRIEMERRIMRTQMACRDNVAEVYLMARQLLTRQPQNGQTRSIDLSFDQAAPELSLPPPSLGALCAIIIQRELRLLKRRRLWHLRRRQSRAARDGDEVDTIEAGTDERPRPSSRTAVTQADIRSLPPACQTLVRHSYPCVSCRRPVSGTNFRPDDLITMHLNPADGGRGEARSAEVTHRLNPSAAAISSTEALPPLREVRFLPGLRRKPGQFGASERVLVGGRGPWLAHHFNDDPASLDRQSHEGDRSNESEDDDEASQEVDWRFCAECAVAHLGPIMMIAAERRGDHGHANDRSDGGDSHSDANTEGISFQPPADRAGIRLCYCVLCERDRRETAAAAADGSAGS
ncbi:hypothetical protein V8E36_001502 [Tilletia maclaganii]